MGTSLQPRPRRGAHSHHLTRHPQDLLSTCFIASLWAEEPTHVKACFVDEREGGGGACRAAGCGEVGVSEDCGGTKERGGSDWRGGGPLSDGGEVGEKSAASLGSICWRVSTNISAAAGRHSFTHTFFPKSKLCFARRAQQHSAATTAVPTLRLDDRNTPPSRSTHNKYVSSTLGHQEAPARHSVTFTCVTCEAAVTPGSAFPTFNGVTRSRKDGSATGPPTSPQAVLRPINNYLRHKVPLFCEIPGLKLRMAVTSKPGIKASTSPELLTKRSKQPHPNLHHASLKCYIRSSLCDSAHPLPTSVLPSSSNARTHTLQTLATVATPLSSSFTWVPTKSDTVASLLMNTRTPRAPRDTLSHQWTRTQVDLDVTKRSEQQPHTGTHNIKRASVRS
ncbi:hypothetical protein E2C01_002588 [Portunus trituberculatus]|uniref:Uncharacterized protein n=1 Tax=Portunus trituberculatus TaxID=210409 RepID=A0A5B7CLM6_PORTR|nr:hypothetical protein [Portunus trituberculatus]